MTADVADPAGAKPYLRRRTVVGAGLGAAAVALVATLRPWADGVVQDAVLGRAQVTAVGSAVAGVAVTALIAGMAGLLAATIAGRIARAACGIAVVVAGAVAGLAAVRVLRDPAAALTAATGATVGRTGGVPAAGSATVWPWLTVAGSVGLILAGLLVLTASSGWGTRTARFDAPGAADRPSPAADDTEWDRLSRGEDPTVGGTASEVADRSDGPDLGPR